MAKLIKDYSSKTSTKLAGDEYACRFVLTGIHQSLANAFRRVVLADIPVVGFDDTYHDNPAENSIKMHKNISSLHNEFVAHRISLVPVCMYKDDRIKIKVGYDAEETRLDYSFVSDELPIFTLNIKNTDETRKELKITSVDNNIDVTTEYFRIKENDDGDVKFDVSKLLIPDYITGDYILLHIIKPISTSEEVQDAEELDVEMHLTIGTAYENSRYCPVGTISYEFVKDEQGVIDENFRQYMDSLQNQRAVDELPPFNDKDVDQFRRSYMLLDAEKIYKKKDNGEPDSILINVESVGNLESKQIVYDAFSILEMKTMLLMNIFSWNGKAKKYTYNENKLTIDVNQKNGFVELAFTNETHTLGNLISSYLKKLFILDKILGEYLTFASYKKPHPLEEKIVISLGIMNSKNYAELFSRFDLPLASKPEDIAINLCMMAMSAYLSSLSVLKSDWTTLTRVNSTSFVIDVSDENTKNLLESEYDRRKVFNTLI